MVICLEAYACLISINYYMVICLEAYDCLSRLLTCPTTSPLAMIVGVFTSVTRRQWDTDARIRYYFRPGIIVIGKVLYVPIVN